jgi:tRNA threonylcarbamoyladenosine biosynthesis protein TsaE
MVRTSSLEEFKGEARVLAKSLMLGTEATVIALSGDLGAGKTTFAKEIAKTFDIEEGVTSPTFVIEKIYVCGRGPFRKLIHIDAYRLKDSQELRALGWDEVVRVKENLIILEWPEHVPGLVPERAVRATIKITGEDSRDIEYGQE